MTGVYRRVGRHLARYWTGLATLAVFMASAQLLQVLNPWPLKYLLDGVLVGRRIRLPFATFTDATTHQRLVAAAVLAVVYFGIIVTGVLLSAAGTYTIARVALRMIHDLRSDLVTHMRRLSLRFHSNQSVGDSIFRAINDARSIQDVVIYGIGTFSAPLLRLLLMITLMAWLSPILALVAVAVGPPLLWAIRKLSKRIQDTAFDSREHLSRLTALIERTMVAIRAVQVFGQEADEQSKFRDTSLAFVGAQLRFRTWEQILNVSTVAIIGVGSALVMGVAAQQVISGVLTVGTLYVFMSYMQTIYNAMQQVMQVWAPFQDALVGVSRAFQVLDEVPDIDEPTDAVQKTTFDTSLRLRNVSMEYDSGRRVLDGIDLEVGRGEKVAIVGETGSGKTTLLSLIPRLYDVSDGSLEIDGLDVRTLSVSGLRGLISMVPQEPLLFSATIGENILYGRLDATQEEVERAATLARASGFIAELPKGFDTEIGERGIRLSTGQQQRISIARAFLKDAPILLLDEPTSALDLKTEADFLEGLDELMMGRTVFIVAHRLSTIRTVDRIYVLEAGHVVESGSHDELMATGGAYRSLYMRQFGNDPEPVA